MEFPKENAREFLLKRRAHYFKRRIKLERIRKFRGDPPPDDTTNSMSVMGCVEREVSYVGGGDD